MQKKGFVNRNSLPLSLIDSTLRCFVSHNSQYSRHNVHVHYRYLDLLTQCTCTLQVSRSVDNVHVHYRYLDLLTQCTCTLQVSRIMFYSMYMYIQVSRSVDTCTLQVCLLNNVHVHYRYLDLLIQCTCTLQVSRSVDTMYMYTTGI